MSHDLSAIAAALRELPGVAAAAVDADPHGGVDALRLGLAPGVNEVEVAGAASRLVHERFGSVVDAAHVHVMTADSVPPQPQSPSASDRAPVVPAPRAVRPEIVRTDMVTTGLEFSATVVLSSQSRAATGDAHGALTSTGMHRAVAQATLRAVERLTRDNVRIELEHLDITPAGQDRTVLVALTLVSTRGAERLTGAAVVRDDESRAVVKATLDALNRRLEPLLES